MGKVIELLDCAEINEKENAQLGALIAKAQRRQYKEMIEAGANDEDDVDEVLEKYPQCKLKFNE